MSDNFAAPGVGTVFSSDEINGIHYPKTKIAMGVNGVATDVDSNNPFPVTLADETLAALATTSLSAPTLAALETTELGAATLAALENTTVTVSGSVELGAASLSALENTTVSIAGQVDLGAASLAALETTELGAATLAALENTTITLSGPVELSATSLAALETTELGAASLAALETTELGAATLAALETTELGAVTLAALEQISVTDTLTPGANRSGTTAAGSKPVMAANAARTGGSFQNLSDTAMYLNQTGEAATATNSFMIPAGAGVNIITNQAVAVFCAVAGKAFAAIEV